MKMKKYPKQGVSVYDYFLASLNKIEFLYFPEICTLQSLCKLRQATVETAAWPHPPGNAGSFAGGPGLGGRGETPTVSQKLGLSLSFPHAGLILLCSSKRLTQLEN